MVAAIRLEDGLSKTGIKDLKKGTIMGMKIAVSFEKEEVFQHFGQTPSFKFYQIEKGKVECHQHGSDEWNRA